MLVDRRKDNYDELLVLARDARASRSRTNRWTTGIVISAVVGTGAYVAAMSGQVESLRQAKDAAETRAEQRNVELANLLAAHAALQAERDAYQATATKFAALAPPGIDGPGLVQQLSKEFQEALKDFDPSSFKLEPPYTNANFVWYVDGSRRFPMAKNDVLWIPEGRFWVRLEESDTISIHEGPRPPATQDEAPAFPMRVAGAYYERPAPREGANCVRIELDNRSMGGFGPEYVDMIITWYNNENCADRYVTPENPAEPPVMSPAPAPE